MREAVARYREDAPLPTIAKQLGISVGYVNVLLGRAGMRRTRVAGRKQAVTDAARAELRDRAVNAYLAGASLLAVASSLGRGESLIRRLLSEAGVRERDRER